MRPERIGDEVRRELSRFGPAEGMTEIVRAWPEAVGEQIAQNAWPARLSRDGKLHVATSSSAWAFELAQLEPKLLEHLSEALGDRVPAGLRFAPGKLPEPAAAGGLRARGVSRSRHSRTSRQQPSSPRGSTTKVFAKSLRRRLQRASREPADGRSI